MRDGFDGVVLQQQRRAEIGAADAPAGIDARPQQKAEMERLRRAVEPRRVHQCGEADILAPPHRDQALADKGAVETDERHDVGDGAERDEIEIRQKIGLAAPAIPETAPAQFAVQRNERDEDEPDGGEMIEMGQIVGPVRIDQSRDVRQLRIALMMVDHHHVEAELARLRERLEARGPAIDGDEQSGALLGERADRFGVRAVALEQPVGDMDHRRQAAMAQEAREQCRRCRAIDVVVAEDRDRLAVLDRVGEALPPPAAWR